MPDPQAERRAIRSRIKTHLVDPNPGIVWILREDIGTSTAKPPPSQDHVIIDILPARSSQAAMGTPRLFRTRGVLVFRIATPLDKGSARNEEIAGIIMPKFRGVLDTSVSPAVRYFTPLWTPRDPDDEDVWFIGRLSVDWQADYNEP